MRYIYIYIYIYNIHEREDSVKRVAWVLRCSAWKWSCWQPGPRWGLWVSGFTIDRIVKPSFPNRDTINQPADIRFLIVLAKSKVRRCGKCRANVPLILYPLAVVRNPCSVISSYPRSLPRLPLDTPSSLNFARGPKFRPPIFHFVARSIFCLFPPLFDFSTFFSLSLLNLRDFDLAEWLCPDFFTIVPYACFSKLAPDSRKDSRTGGNARSGQGKVLFVEFVKSREIQS